MNRRSFAAILPTFPLLLTGSAKDDIVLTSECSLSEHMQVWSSDGENVRDVTEVCLDGAWIRRFARDYKDDQLMISGDSFMTERVEGSFVVVDSRTGQPWPISDLEKIAKLTRGEGNG